MPEKQPKKTIDERFAKFHENNPQVFNLIVKEARLALKQGMDKFSVRQICEYVRWHIQLHTKDDPMFSKSKGEKVKFKINNDYSSRYARLLLERYPEFAGKIELREIISK